MQKKPNIFQKFINTFYGHMTAKLLVRKLVIFVGIAFLFVFLSLIAGKNDIVFIIETGLILGYISYIPIRIKEYFGIGWLRTFLIFVAYIGITGTLVLKKGFEWLGIILILLPIIDMGLSIYAVITNNKGA